MELTYNYVFFNTGGIKHRRVDTDEYYYICARDLRKIPGVKVVSYPLDYAPFLFHLLFTAHNAKFEKWIHLPLKWIWYPFYYKGRFDDDKPVCFVIGCQYIFPDYIRYLKKKYPDCKIVLLHRDLMKLWKKRMPAYSDETGRELIDLEMTYDELDAEKYGMVYFQEIASKIPVTRAPGYPLSDIFFAGYAKDRLKLLVKIYDVLTDAGYQCSYYIVGAEPEEQIQRSGIEYAQKKLSYKEMLYRTVNAKCILEINQADAAGYTSRFLEAVMYDKLLITNNTSVKKSKFYNPRYIQCIKNEKDITPEFISDHKNVRFHYKGEFSPVHLIRQIDDELTQCE